MVAGAKNNQFGTERIKMLKTIIIFLTLITSLNLNSMFIKSTFIKSTPSVTQRSRILLSRVNNNLPLISSITTIPIINNRSMTINFDEHGQDRLKDSNKDRGKSEQQEKDEQQKRDELLWKEAIEIFIKRSSIRDHEECNASFLSYAACGNTKCIKLFITKCYITDINVKTNKGTTALILAARYGHMDIVKLLIDAGADINIKDNYDNSALVYAEKLGHNNIVELLKNNGAI